MFFRFLFSVTKNLQIFVNTDFFSDFEWKYDARLKGFPFFVKK